MQNGRIRQADFKHVLIFVFLCLWLSNCVKGTDTEETEARVEITMIEPEKAVATLRASFHQLVGAAAYRDHTLCAFMIDTRELHCAKVDEHSNVQLSNVPTGRELTLIFLNQQFQYMSTFMFAAEGADRGFPYLRLVKDGDLGFLSIRGNHMVSSNQNELWQSRFFFDTKFVVFDPALTDKGMATASDFDFDAIPDTFDSDDDNDLKLDIIDDDDNDDTVLDSTSGDGEHFYSEQLASGLKTAIAWYRYDEQEDGNAVVYLNVMVKANRTTVKGIRVDALAVTQGTIDTAGEPWDGTLIDRGVGPLDRYWQAVVKLPPERGLPVNQILPLQVQSADSATHLYTVAVQSGPALRFSNVDATIDSDDLVTVTWKADAPTVPTVGDVQAVFFTLVKDQEQLFFISNPVTMATGKVQFSFVEHRANQDLSALKYRLIYQIPSPLPGTPALERRSAVKIFTP